MCTALMCCFRLGTFSSQYGHWYLRKEKEVEPPLPFPLPWTPLLADLEFEATEIEVAVLVPAENDDDRGFFLGMDLVLVATSRVVMIGFRTGEEDGEWPEPGEEEASEAKAWTDVAGEVETEAEVPEGDDEEATERRVEAEAESGS